MFIKRGGGIIKRKLLLSVLLLFGLALVLNVNSASAANVTIDKSIPKVTAIDPVNNGVVLNNKIINIKFSEPIKNGNKLIVLKSSSGLVKSTKNTINGKILSIAPKTPLTKGTKYQILINSGSVKDLAGNSITSFSTSFKVSSLTLAQVKDGLSRTQKFYNTNYRLPNYVSFGSTKVPISDFQKIIASQGLKIKVVSSGIGKITGRPVYITSDNINNKGTDNARINSIVNGLRALGINAHNMGLGPNTHITALQSSQVPNNALVVDIYGGADAGLIKEMGSSWYLSIKGTKKVFTVYWPPTKLITGLSYLVRAHDDNYDPASFKGLAHPDQYMLKLGYNYLYSGSIASIVNAVVYQATH
jgi:hypothetical protein